MHGRKYRNAARTCDVVFANSAFTADDFADTLALPARARARRAPGHRARVPARRRRRRPRRPVPAHGRDARAAQEPRHARRGVRAARATPVSRSSSPAASGWGEQPQLDRPGIVRLGRVTDDELARLYRGARPSSTRRGSRASACRSPRRWRPARPSSPRRTRRWTRRPATRPSAPTPRARRRSPTAIREAVARRDELRARGARARAALLVAPRRRGLPRGVRAIRVALDTTPLLPDARGDGALRARAARPPRRRPVEVSFPATSRLRTLAADAVWYPRLRAPRGADVLHCPTFRGPFRARGPLVVTVHDLAVLRHPEWFNRWTATYSRFAVPRVVRAAVARDRRLGVHAARARRAARRRRGRDPRRAERGRGRLHARRPARRRATTCSRSARSSRARTSRASRRRSTASCASSARAAGAASSRRANVTWLGDVSDEELAALYRGARCLVYASLYEGFGIPVAEALACGCPIVTSAGSPMAEIAGDDATYVDPHDVESIRAGIARAFAPASAPRSRPGPRSPSERAPSTRSSRDPRRRRRARPQPHGRGDLRAQPAAPAAAGRTRPASFAAVTRHPELVPDGRRGDRAARAAPGAAHGVVAAAAAAAPAARARALPARAAARLARPERRHAARPALRARSRA